MIKRKEVSAFNRRVKEFHNIDNFKENNFTSYGVLEKEFKNNNYGLTERNNEEKTDHKRYRNRNLSSLAAENSLDFQFDGNMSARQNLVESLKSNIFNGDVKIYFQKRKKYFLKKRLL